MFVLFELFARAQEFEELKAQYLKGGLRYGDVEGPPGRAHHRPVSEAPPAACRLRAHPHKLAELRAAGAEGLEPPPASCSTEFAAGLRGLTRPMAQFRDRIADSALELRAWAHWIWAIAPPGGGACRRRFAAAGRAGSGACRG